MSLSLFKLDEGSVVTLVLNSGTRRETTENALFLGVIGENDDARARFLQLDRHGDQPTTFEWEAYRYNDRWAYGSSADGLRVESVNGSL